MKIDFNDITELAQGTAMDVWGPREPAKLLEKLKEEVSELEEAWAGVVSDSNDVGKKTRCSKRIR